MSWNVSVISKATAGRTAFLSIQNIQPVRMTSRDCTVMVDLFNNPVGYLTSLGKMLRILLFLSGCCSETEVSEQL
jgi:hypothetical protein